MLMTRYRPAIAASALGSLRVTVGFAFTAAAQERLTPWRAPATQVLPCP